MAYFLRQEKRKRESICKCMRHTEIKKRSSPIQKALWHLAMLKNSFPMRSRIPSLTIGNM